jgi:hypothetical protein
MAQLTSKVVIRRHNKKAVRVLTIAVVEINTKDMKIQQFADWVTVQNEIVFKVEVGSIVALTIEAESCENFKNFYVNRIPTNSKACPIYQNGEHKPKQWYKIKIKDGCGSQTLL